MKRNLFLTIIVLCTLMSNGQEKSVQPFNPECLNWYNKDLKLDKLMGTSVDMTYDSLLVNMKPKKTVVVAVIDGGVDIYHEDLTGKIWTNPGEIPGNLMDDDSNGYVDDINGWNFIGNQSGENVEYENYEFTRLIKVQSDSNLLYNKALNLHAEKLTKKNAEKERLQSFEEMYLKNKTIILQKSGVDVLKKEDINKINSTDKQVLEAKNFMSTIYRNGFTVAELQKMKKENENNFTYYLNKGFDPRIIVGDNPLNIDDRNYGNNNVKGPRSDHGTSVAGVIAAIRNNEIGIDGIVSAVKIMALRVVPNGDERDKDVALAIRYAVDNGADIINMSFGKQISPQKQFVDDAIKYAEQHGVLLVHGAGNDGYNTDIIENFPNKKYLNGNTASNLLNVGATKKELNKRIPALFSDYGEITVDLFAPGVDIISLDSSNAYAMHSGTSFSAPVVTGIAALLLSYFPELSPKELIDIMLESTYKFSKPKKVITPGLQSKKRPKVPFSKLSRSGGVVNAYSAMVLAGKRKPE